MVSSIIRTIFAQADREHIEKQFGEVTTMLGLSDPEVTAMLTDAQPELLAFAAFPRHPWRRIWSTNPLNGSTKRSNAAPMWSMCSPTPQPCCAWSGRC